MPARLTPELAATLRRQNAARLIRQLGLLGDMDQLRRRRRRDHLQTRPRAGSRERRLYLDHPPALRSPPAAGPRNRRLPKTSRQTPPAPSKVGIASRSTIQQNLTCCSRDAYAQCGEILCREETRFRADAGVSDGFPWTIDDRQAISGGVYQLGHPYCERGLCTECRSGSSLASSSLRWTVCMEAHFPAPQG